jgi:hypothetical protein
MEFCIELIWIGAMDFRRLILSSTLIGLGVAILSRLPLTSVCDLFFCGWAWMAGFLAVWHYNYLGGGMQDEAGQTVKAKPIGMREGMILGAMAGLIATLIGAVLYYYQLQFIGVDNLLEGASGIFGISESELWETFPTIGISREATIALFDLLIRIFIYPSLSSLGGYLGAVFFIRRAKNEPPSIA